MTGFQVGDRIQLKAALAEGKTSQTLQAAHKGQIIEVTGESYTVQFDDTKAAVEGVSANEIELEE